MVVAEDAIVNTQEFVLVLHLRRITELRRRGVIVITVANGNESVARFRLEQRSQVPEEQPIGAVPIPVGRHAAKALADGRVVVVHVPRNLQNDDYAFLMNRNAGRLLRPMPAGLIPERCRAVA